MLAVQDVPPMSCAIMVQKNYADRVVDFLLRVDRSYILSTNITDTSATTTTTATKCVGVEVSGHSVLLESYQIASLLKRKPSKESSYHIDGVLRDCRGVELLDYSDRSGVSRTRRGYFLLLLPPLQRCVSEISPMARQNISWISRITHRCDCYGGTMQPKEGVSDTIGSEVSTTTPEDKGADGILTKLAYHWWNACLASGFDCTNSSHQLRVECHPKFLLESVCYSLQCRCAAWQSSSPTPDVHLAPLPTSHNNNGSTNNISRIAVRDPFEGPIAMTVSRSKCSHRLTIVLSPYNGLEHTIATDRVTSRETASDYSFGSTNPDSFRFRHCYWGVDYRINDGHNHHQNHHDHNYNGSAWFDVPLNHDAAAEITVIPYDCVTGADHVNKRSSCDGVGGLEGGDPVLLDGGIPLSRAYYKLEEAWTNYIRHYPISFQHPDDDSGTLPSSPTPLSDILAGKAAIDIGAAPGGWTQVLAVRMQMSPVVAVDPGRIALRVRQLPAVYPLQCNLQNADWLSPLEQHATATTALTGATSSTTVRVGCGPSCSRTANDLSPSFSTSRSGSASSYSVLVCDASITYVDLLQLLQRHVLSQVPWSVPALMVVTMKLPFKTPGSVSTHVHHLQQHVLPTAMKSMVQLMYRHPENVTVEYSLVHLMANSEGERTLMAFFSPTG